MGTKKERQNLRDAKTYFNYNFSKPNDSSIRDKFDPEMFGVGMRWFNKGRSLEIAPSNFRNNTNFINGFNRAKTMKLVDDMLSLEKEFYELGRQFCLNKINLDDVNEKYKNNPSFIAGFNDALSEIDSQRR